MAEKYDINLAILPVSIDVGGIRMTKDLVIIDSGVNCQHPLLKGISIDNAFVNKKNNEYIIQHGGEDHVGHGTAVCGTIFSGLEDKISVDALMINIYEDELVVELEALIYALQYIEAFVECKVLHISSGVLEYSAELHMLCKKLCEKGVCIVAAFDNSGAVSYPAAFAEVIGVDASFECRRTNEWIYVEEGIVNVLAKGGIHRIAWLSSSYILSQGASFSAGYITSQIIRHMGKGCSQAEIHGFLRENALKIYNQTNSDHITAPVSQPLNFSIQKAALFPYNKEMHSLVNFCDMLPFSIVGIYDSKYVGRVGQNVKSLDGKQTFEIQSVDDIDWTTFDTLIVGHLQEVSRAASIEYKSIVVEQCLAHGINVYAFDSDGFEQYRPEFYENGIGLYYPEINRNSLPKKDGKLYTIGTPVLGVFGTSSIQGKYTLQLMLRKLFLQSGYNIGQLGSEPTALLFGMNRSYAFGYASSVDVYEDEAVEVINAMMHEIELEQPDIILVGSQSGTIPAYYHSTKLLNIPQMVFLLATKPDAVVLCVNIYDSIEYIQRTINAIESLSESTIVALAVSPMVYPDDFALAYRRKVPAEKARVRVFVDTLRKNVKKPVFNMMDEVTQLFSCCISFFSNDEED